MANPGDIRLGPDWRVRINNTAFACIEGTLQTNHDKAKTTDSESQSGAAGSSTFELVKPGISRMIVSLTAQRDTTVTLGAGPLLIDDGAYIDIKMYPSGTALPGYHAPTFLVDTLDHSFRVEGSAVQTIRLSGQSSGIFYEDYDFA